MSIQRQMRRLIRDVKGCENVRLECYRDNYWVVWMRLSPGVTMSGHHGMVVQSNSAGVDETWYCLTHLERSARASLASARRTLTEMDERTGDRVRVYHNVLGEGEWHEMKHW